VGNAEQYSRSDEERMLQVDSLTESQTQLSDPHPATPGRMIRVLHFQVIKSNQILFYNANTSSLPIPFRERERDEGRALPRMD
jgi:hypothetical protein